MDRTTRRAAFAAAPAGGRRERRWWEHVRSRPAVVRYGMALAIVGLGVGLRTLLGTFAVTRAPFSLFHIFVLAAAVLCGRGAGVLVSLLFEAWAFGAGMELDSYPEPAVADGVMFLLSAIPVALIGDGLLRVHAEVQRRARSELAVQERLRATRQVLELHLNNSPLAVVEWDEKGRITRWSGAAEALFGWTEPEVLGRAYRDFRFVYEDDADGVNAVVTDLYAGRLSESVRRNRNYARDGRVLWCEWYNSVLRDTDGGVTSVLSFVLDVTARHVAELALRESEMRFRTLADSSPTMKWVTDATGAVDFVNEAYREFFGLDVQEVNLRGWDSFVHPEDREAYRRAFEEARRRQVAFRARARLRRADGAWRWIDTQALPRFDAHGAYAGHVGSSPDVTELEEARAAAERAAVQRDEFLANLSHELRTPLNGMLGWAQVLLRTPGLDAGVTRAVAAIERSARAQAQLIGDLLDLNRILGGRLRLDFETLDLAPVIDAALETVRPAAAVKAVAIAADLEPGCAVWGDAARLQQVVWNLLSNALKFTPEGGDVHTALRRVPGGVEITVRDTGRGIGPEFLPHVFDRFRQEDATSTRRFGGLGLGLAIVRHLVEQHGGRVAAESAGEGRGSLFRVLLPAAPPDRAPVAAGVRPESVPAEALHGLAVLVVDDEEDACEVAGAILRGAGARVRCATSAAVALAGFADGRPDVLVSDIAMPDMDGYGLVRTLRERGVRVPAVALTAFARDEDRARALAEGFTGFLPKPVDAALLVATVAEAARIGRRTAAD